MCCETASQKGLLQACFHHDRRRTGLIARMVVQLRRTAARPDLARGGNRRKFSEKEVEQEACMWVALRGADWSERTIAQLRHLWIEGHTTTEIGRRLGISKKAIIGKAHRLDLPGRKSPINQGIEPSPHSITRLPRVSNLGEVAGAGAPIAPVAAPPQHPLTAAPPITRGILPQSDTERCCWPFGNPKAANFRFFLARPRSLNDFAG